MADIDRTAAALPAEEAGDLVVAIDGLPEGEALAAVGSLASQPRPAIIAALETLAGGARPAVAAAAIDALGRLATAEAAGALAALGERLQDREQRKLARRTLHRLVAAGVRPAAAPAPGRRPVPFDEYQLFGGLASAIDARGERIVHVALVEAAGGIVLFTALIGDEGGLREFVDRRLGRRRFAEERQELLGREWPTYIEVPAAYARFLIAEAIARAQEAHRPVPVETLPWYELIMAGRTAYERPLIYEHVDVAEIRWNPAYLEESPALLDLPELAAWGIDPDAVAPFDPEAEAQEARLVLPGQAQRQQTVTAVTRAIAALFDAPARERWRRRLEETAYVLLRRGSERNARRAVAAALALERPPGGTVLGGEPSVHPLLRALVERAFELRRHEREQRMLRRGGLWVPRAAE
ncbi:MAG: hypothetical protein HYU88_03450 [Chloroflexi bacterium]|nr:hypothetical protein [Chloroflexota bacterium]